MICPRCRQKSPPGARFCPTCGAPLSASARPRRPASIQPILNAIVKTAARLCDAHYAQILLIDGAQLRVAAKHSSMPRSTPVGGTFPLTRESVASRAVLDRRTVHVRYLKAAIKSQFVAVAGRQRATGLRTLLGTPLLHEGLAVGVLDVVAKNAARICEAPDASIALVQGNEVPRVAWYSTLHTSPPPDPRRFDATPS
jgi:hypothetical protein